MNLVDSILLTSNASKYSHIFKKHKIDASTLKLLSSEDLALLGVENEETRNLIVKQASNLQIPADKRLEILIDKEYIEDVLKQMSIQLNRHLATLSIGSSRKDLLICDIKLVPATKCLHKSLQMLQDELELFEQTVLCVGEPVRQDSTISLILGATFGAIAAFAIYRYFPLRIK